VDSNALQAALQQNPAAVQNFLQTATTGFVANLNTVINNMVSPANGSLTLDAQSINQSSNDLGDQISDMQASLAVQQQQLTETYAQVNTALQESAGYPSGNRRPTESIQIATFGASENRRENPRHPDCSENYPRSRHAHGSVQRCSGVVPSATRASRPSHQLRDGRLI